MPEQKSKSTQTVRTIPPATRPEERTAATQRQTQYPYRFPRDPRKLGGKFTVAENGRRLLRFFYFERRLAQALGSWTLTIPDFEVKIETGRHIFAHADAAKRLRDRLYEQERRLSEIDVFRDPEIDGFIDEMLSAQDTPELLVGVHQVVGRALEVAYRHHIDDTCPVADAPTIRMLRHILLDFEPMLTWAEAALAAYIEGGIEEARLEGWRWHLSRLLASLGGVTGAEERAPRPALLRSEAKPYERGVLPCRDSRFATFTTTGDYNLADGAARYLVGSYEDQRLKFIRTQRDEVDAIEVFGDPQLKHGGLQVCISENLLQTDSRRPPFPRSRGKGTSPISP